MKFTFLKLIHRARFSFWFVPSVMSAVACLLAYLVLAVDPELSRWVATHWGWTFTGGASGASLLLGAIAASMVTIAGVVFSMTLVALSMTASQLGPRLLRSFMRDTTTQAVLGTFTATFLFCLLVLRRISPSEEDTYVPHLAVGLAVVFSVVSLGVLIYFIHHVSISIQANDVVARVAHELFQAIDEYYPINGVEPDTERELPSAELLATVARDSAAVPADGDGYVQFINEAALLALATEEDLVIGIRAKIGRYVVLGQPLVFLWPPQKVAGPTIARINAAFSLGNQRTFEQDVGFPINQLVEIAIRALSPALNDPFTAMSCVDRLGSALARLARRDGPSGYRFDDNRALRLIAPVLSFPHLLDTSINQIRQYGRTSAAVTIRLLEALSVVALGLRRGEDANALARQAAMIVRGGRAALPEEEDVAIVEDRYRELLRCIPSAFLAVSESAAVSENRAPPERLRTVP